MLVHSSDFGKHVVDFSVGPSWAKLGHKFADSQTMAYGLPSVVGGARTMVEDDHPEAALIWV